jgi:hypothetical protein
MTQGGYAEDFVLEGVKTITNQEKNRGAAG